MKTFKELKESLVLLEILTLPQKKKVDTWEKGDNSFSDHMYKDHPHDAKFDLESPSEDSEHKPHIEDHISKHGFKIKDYKKGIATDKYGRETSIGKALVKTKAPIELKHKFDNDPSRQQQQSSDDTHHVVISRHPHHVAGMTSKGHEWQSSCMNFTGGMYNHHLKDDVKHGTHVAYLAHKKDDKIKSPLARVALKKFTNVDDPNDHILRPENRTYGNAPDSFTHTVHRAIERYFPGRHDAIYKKNENVYNDGGNKYIVGKNALDKGIVHKDNEVREISIQHPDLQPHHISKILDGNEHSHYHKNIAIMHPNVTKEQLDKVMNGNDANMLVNALRHDKITEEHLSKAIRHPNSSVRLKASEHPNLNSDHIHHILDNDDQPAIKENAVSHKNAKREHIVKALKTSHYRVVAAALSHKDLKPEEIGDALNHENHSVRSMAVSNPNATSEHIHKGLDDKNVKVRREAIRHENATPEHINKALDDEDENVVSNAIKHKNISNENIHKILDSKHENSSLRITDLLKNNKSDKITGEHISKALKNQGVNVRREALKHKAATYEHAKEGMKDHHLFVLNSAYGHPDITSEDIHNGLNHEHPMIRERAISHPKATKEHFEKMLNDPDANVARVAKEGMEKNK